MFQQSTNPRSVTPEELIIKIISQIDAFIPYLSYYDVISAINRRVIETIKTFRSIEGFHPFSLSASGAVTRK